MKYYLLQSIIFQLTVNRPLLMFIMLMKLNTHLSWRSRVPNRHRSEDMSPGGKVQIGSVSLHRHPLKVQLHTEPQHKQVTAFPYIKYKSQHRNSTAEMKEL